MRVRTREWEGWKEDCGREGGIVGGAVGNRGRGTVRERSVRRKRRGKMKQGEVERGRVHEEGWRGREEGGKGGSMSERVRL